MQAAKLQAKSQTSKEATEQTTGAEVVDYGTKLQGNVDEFTDKKLVFFFSATTRWSTMHFFICSKLIYQFQVISRVVLYSYSFCGSVGAVVKDIAIGAGGLGLTSRTGQMEQSRHRCDATSGLCCPGAKPRKWVLPLVARFGVVPRE